MRLWHKDLLEVLPKQQLLGQWRELNSIFSRENKHILINFIYDDYNLDHFYSYSTLLVCEMALRGYKIDQTKMINYFKDKKVDYLPIELIYKEKMGKRYLKQCLYNLQEKFDEIAKNKANIKNMENGEVCEIEFDKIQDFLK